MEKNLIDFSIYNKPKNSYQGGNTSINYNITSSGGLNTDFITVNSLNVNNITADEIDTNVIKSGIGNFVYIYGSEGRISVLENNILTSDKGNITEIDSNYIGTNKLQAYTGNITNLFNDYLQSREITTDYLTVNKAAHFFEVVIDKIRSVSGTIINTATSCIIDYVKPLNANKETPEEGESTSFYRCFWKQEDNEGNKTTNDWITYDQAISQSLNLSEGINHETGTHYYWRLVRDVSEDTTYVNFSTGDISSGVASYDENTGDFLGYVAPPYNITFNNDWNYSNGQGMELSYTYFDIIPQEPDSFDMESYTWNVTNTQYGIQVKPKKKTNSLSYSSNTYYNIRSGYFTFSTDKLTKLNVLFHWDSDSLEYHKAEEYQSYYNIRMYNDTNAILDNIIITSEEVNVFQPCHWIDLSNIQGEYEEPQNMSGFDMIPAPKDNLVQLGFNYKKLAGYENTPAWRAEHTDEIKRGNAQIQAAFYTPDREVVPPSFAQYEDINDFSLSSHRMTYFDSTGGYFKGNLVSKSGNLIEISDEGLDIDSNFENYKIIPPVQVIYLNSQNNIIPDVININFLHIDNNTDEITNTVPLSCYFQYSYNTYTSGLIGEGIRPQITLYDINTSTRLSMNLFKDNKIKDSVSLGVISVETASEGRNGNYTQWIYCNSETEPQISSSYQGLPAIPPSWSEEVPVRSANSYIWFSNRLVSYSTENTVYLGNWSNIIRLTGDDGHEGTDGKYTEFIYKHFQTPQVFTSNNNNPNYWEINNTRDYLGPQNYRWSDNPEGITEVYSYEYVSQRTFNGNTFSKFSTPVLWSKWGEKGQDGDGFEYIFKHSTTYINQWEENNSNPAYWNAVQEDDYLGPQSYEWSDEPQGVSDIYLYEYMSQRKRENGVWSKFTEPKLFAHFASQGSNGGSYKMMYKNSETKPGKPVNGSSVASLINLGWSEQPQDPDFETGEYTFMTQTFISGAGIIGEWTEPVRLTGENGKAGEDGKYTEFIYQRFSIPHDWDNDSSNLNPSSWTAYQAPDYTGQSEYGWSDNPKGVSYSYIYEYMAQREFNGKVFSQFTTPVLWSKYGEKGQDGDGFEYIYKRFNNVQSWESNDFNPSYWNASQTEDYLGPTSYQWEDEPQGVTDYYIYEYVSQRKRENGVWSKFSEPALWAHYAAQGSNGGHYEVMYKVSDTKPQTPASGTTIAQMITLGWSITPEEPDFNLGEYTFMTQAFVSGAGVIGEWSEPIKITGENGERGADGNKTEFIFYRTETLERPEIYQDYNDFNPSITDGDLVEYFIRPGDEGYNLDTNLIRKWKDSDNIIHYSNSLDYIPPSFQSANILMSGWTDEPQGVTDEYIYEWVGVREYDGEIWGKFSTPVVWAKWGQDGLPGTPGPQGGNGEDGEYITIVPVKENFSVEITEPGPSSRLDDISGSLKTELYYAIAHTKGNVIEYIDDFTYYKMCLKTDNSYVNNYIESTSYQNILIGERQIPCLKYTNNNLLDVLNSSLTSSYSDYYWLIKNGKTAYMPTYISVSVYDSYSGSYITDARSVNLKFNPSHIFSVTDTALNSIYQGLSGSTGPYTYTGFSQIHQEWDNIGLSVSNIKAPSQGDYPKNTLTEEYVFYTQYVNGNVPDTPETIYTDNNTGHWTTYSNTTLTQSYTDKYISHRERQSYFGTEQIEYSSWSGWSQPQLYETFSYGILRTVNSAELNILADNITSYVRQSFSNSLNMSYSYISQKADEVSIQVVQDIDDALISTGVDIQQGRIILNADNTVITGNNLILNQNQGMVLKDDDDFNNIVISSKDITDFTADENTVNVGGKFNTDIAYFSGNNTETIALTVEDNILQQFSVGDIPVGSSIKLSSGPYLRIKCSNPSWKYTSGNWIEIDDWNNKYITVNLLRDGTTIQSVTRNATTLSGTAMPSAQTMKVTISGDINYTITETGHTYSIEVVIPPVKPASVNWVGRIWGEITLSIEVTHVKNNSITMGTNGAHIISLPFNSYINNSSFTVEDTTDDSRTGANPRTGIKICTSSYTPLQKVTYLNDGLAKDTWVTMGNIKRVLRVSSGPVTVSDSYDVYVIASGAGNITLNLVSAPKKPPIGRTIHIKHLGGTSNNVTIQGNGCSIYNKDVGTSSSSISMTTPTAVELIYIGNDEWIRTS